jgi:hypothetical protein
MVAKIENTKSAAKEVAREKPQIIRKTPAKLRKRLRKVHQPINPTSPSLYRALRISVRQLTNYTYTVLELYPKRHRERFGLGMDITSAANKCLLLTIEIESFGARDRRAELLRQLSLQLKYLEELVEVSFGIYVIDAKKKESWLRQIVTADNVAIGLAMGLDKNEKAGNDAGK